MHESVLLNESIESLNLKEDSIIVDCTLGYGGHSSEILKRIPKGFLYSFDQDIDAINYSKERLSKVGSNFLIIKSNFKNIKEELKKRNVDKVDGIIYDLGVSSPQLDQGDRGFSFHQNGHGNHGFQLHRKKACIVLSVLSRIMITLGSSWFVAFIPKVKSMPISFLICSFAFIIAS